MIDRDLLDDAIRIWGEESQFMMAIEECGELVAALAQTLRGRQVDLAGEIADVIIMTEQLRKIVGPKTVDTAVDQKMERLKCKIEGVKNANRKRVVYDLGWTGDDVG